MNIVGNGVDIIEVRRLKNAIERNGKKFLTRIFTERELKNAKKYNASYQHLAGRFAAKESVFKALSDRKLTFKDVEIINDNDGKPCCSLINSSRNKVNIHISISHIKNYAVASAIITEKENCS